MAMLDLDKIINVTGGGGGMYPGGDNPAPYPIVSQHIGLFNKPNAWDTDSNGWFGLLDSSNNLINAQNEQFNTQIAPAPVSGTGALSTRVKSFDFSTNISSVNSGKVKYTLYNQGGGILTFDLNYGTKTLDNPSLQPYDVASGYIVTNEFNNKKYLFSGAFYYELDSSYNIVAGSEVSFPEDSVSIGYYNSTERFAIINRYAGTYNNEIIKRGEGSLGGTSGNGYQGVVCHYKFNAATGVLENIHTAQFGSTDFRPYGSSITGINEMLVYNTSSSSSHWGHVILYDFATRSVTRNSIIDDEGYTSNIYQWDGNKIWRQYWLSGGGQTQYYSSWTKGTSEYIQTDSKPLASVDMNYSFVTQNNGQAIYDGTQQTEMIVFKPNDGLYIKGGAKIPIKGTPSRGVRYELDDVSQPDDCIKKMTIANAIYGDVTLDINGQTVSQQSYLASVGFEETINIGLVSNINSPSIELTLSYNGFDTGINNELTLGATGGTYGIPTLPVNNGMSSGDATTPWAPGSDASHINLTLST